MVFKFAILGEFRYYFPCVFSMFLIDIYTGRFNIYEFSNFIWM